jgi:hypothetical protein
MPINHSEITRKKGTVRGRECRDQSLNTKLTATEFASVAAAAEADGRALGEWAREVLLKELRSSSGAIGADLILTEIVSLQLFLTDALAPLTCGEKMSAMQYEELMRRVKRTKRKAAVEVIAQHNSETAEDSHV